MSRMTSELLSSRASLPHRWSHAGGVVYSRRSEAPPSKAYGSCRKTCDPQSRPLSEEQLETPYRPGGWTVRQLVHHVADSHMNAYDRVRLALTEDWPTIFAYQENRWAELEDARAAAVSTSLDLVAGAPCPLGAALRVAR